MTTIIFKRDRIQSHTMVLLWCDRTESIRWVLSRHTSVAALDEHAGKSKSSEWRSVHATQKTSWQNRYVRSFSFNMLSKGIRVFFEVFLINSFLWSTNQNLGKGLNFIQNFLLKQTMLLKWKNWNIIKLSIAIVDSSDFKCIFFFPIWTLRSCLSPMLPEQISLSIYLGLDYCLMIL